MCGRFTLSVPGEVLEQAFGLDGTPVLEPRYNIAPTDEIAIVKRTEDGPRVLERARWGLVPSGARDLKIGARMINARQETLFDQPAFRNAARARRCLVPSTGFFEWRADPDAPRKKLPYRIRLKDGRVFAMAGVFEPWAPKDAGGPQGPIETVSVITTTANEAVAPIHDRMPVILHPDDYALWLDPEVRDRAALERLFRPIDAAEMLIEPVSTRVNDVANDDPECIAPRVERPEPARKRQLGFDFG